MTIHCIYNRFYYLLFRFLLCVPSETEKICFTHFFGVCLGCFGKLLFVSLLPGFFLPHYYPVRFIPAFPGEIRSCFSVLFPLHTDLLPGRMLWAIFLFAFDRHKCFRQSFDLIPLPYFCFPVLFTALHPVLPRHSDHFSLFPALCEKNLFISGLCFLHLGLMGILNAFFNYDMSTVGRRLMVILTLILLLMFSTIFYLYLKLKKSKEKLEEKSRLQQYQWELEKQHYLDLQKKDQALRKFRHDYKHHILAMQELAARKDYGELLTYLNDLSHIQSQTASISTNNPVADAIFNYFDSIKPAHTEFCVDGRFQPFMPPFFEIPSGRIVSLWILRYFPLHRCESEILRKNKRWKALPHYKGIPFHQSSLFTFVHSKLPELHCRGLSAHLHIGSIIHIIKVESEHLVEVFPVSINIT